ncbi:hypothetical protein FAVG1_04148 [Fusarium avenaceum]|nr:hypothetical protein DER45DRAFT_643535 [Fusarium avenaceum]KIL92967.1 hypothetical protein FAVG1_04148 [Fusarium avenaceum]
MNLLELPVELLLKICEQGQSSLKSIRLTCRTLGTAATTTLFQHVSISPLRKDPSRFFNIAKTFPDMIRVVTWEEPSRNFNPLENDEADERPLFWTESGLVEPGFLNEFRKAIYKMSGLHTLVYKPVNPRREVRKISLPTMPFGSRRRNRKYLYINGFYNYIIPTLRPLANPLSLSTTIGKRPTITTVIYTDHDMVQFTALTHFKRCDAMAFSTIRNLDLCIGGPRCVRDNLEGFLTCLSNARNLSSFKLSQEACMLEGRSLWFDRDDSDDMATPDAEVPELLSLIPTLPVLTELHLVDPDLRECPEHTSGLIEFIGRHSKTLKRIYLISVSIKKWILPELAAIKLSELERFVVVSKLDMDKDEEKTEHVSEKRAVEYIKGKPNSRIPYQEGDRETELHTHDVDTWRKGSFEKRGKKWKEGEHYPKDAKRPDFEIGDRRDEL